MGIKKRKSKKGFTVIEAIISLVLFTLIMIPLGSFTLTAVKTSVKSATKEQAINAGQGALEQLKTIKLSQLNKIDSDANYSESHKATLKIGNLNVIKTKDNPIYKVEGEYVDPNNKKKFNIDGDIMQGKLEDNGENDKEHAFNDTSLGIDYMVYIGNSTITVHRLIKEGEDKYNPIVKPDWYVIKYNKINEDEINKKRILNLKITKNEDGKIEISCDNEGKPVYQDDKAKINKELLDKNTVDRNINNIKVRFYEDSINKEINLKIANKCIGSQLNVYTYKNKGSGVRYNIYTSTENPHGDVSVFKNYIEGNSEDLRGQLFNINLKVKEKDEVLYNFNTTEFIGG